MRILSRFILLSPIPGIVAIVPDCPVVVPPVVVLETLKVFVVTAIT